jgi:Domain of unknown function (DUF4105)
MRPRFGTILRWVGILLTCLLLLAAHVWATLAIYFANYHQPGWRVVLAACYVCVLLVTVVRFRRRLLAATGIFLIVVVWWAAIQPNGHGNYLQPVRVQAYPEFNDDLVTIHYFRNFDYRSKDDYTVRYEDRTFDLSKLKYVDFIINYWDGHRATAHTALSFEFEDNKYLACSVEIRGQIGETYEFLRGLYKQFELFYVIGDERDVIRVRTNYENEQVYLYRTNCTPDNGRKLLVDILKEADAIRTRPRFYNTLFGNCTTALIDHVNRVLPTKVPFWQERKMNGYSDEEAFKNGWLAGNVPFKQLRAESNITARAIAADQDPNFSAKIRTHLEKDRGREM